jgi:hypothetical protein
VLNPTKSPPVPLHGAGRNEHADDLVPLVEELAPRSATLAILAAPFGGELSFLHRFPIAGMAGTADPEQLEELM